MSFLQSISVAFHSFCSFSYEHSKLTLETFEKWQVILISVSLTILLVRLYDFYIEIDTGNYLYKIFSRVTNFVLIT